ncbi:hypothetical protein FB451DRAFT_1181503 [Mycena latifolia]|nr:hypothetical protein FB451DRAFT_1181503 [Mycena latifolia]
MRLLSCSVCLLAVATVASAVATPTRRMLSLNPAPEDLRNVSAVVSPRAPLALTNAKRLALGLPLLKPHRRVPTPGTDAPTTSPLPPVTTIVNVHARGTDGTDFGYLSPVWNGFGEYGAFQSTQEGSLQLTFSYSPDGPSQISITATNGPSATYPFFGAIAGFASDSDDFGPGSYNYAYIGGTTQSPAGSPPFTAGDNSFSAATGIPESIESAIWIYDPETGTLTAQWINTDGSTPATHIVYANDANQALALTGDVGSFQSAFGAPYPEITFVGVIPTGN